jgi:deoxyribodipyrimidine photo-lyase
VFVIDPVLWNPAGARRRSYIAASLRSLDSSIKAIGGSGVTVLHGDPVAVLPPLAKSLHADVFATADFGPYGAKRDADVARACVLHRISTPFLHAPGDVVSAEGAGYRVFTPFYRAWRHRAASPPAPAPTSWASPPAGAHGQGWHLLDAEPPAPFEVGEESAWQRWDTFAEQGLAAYEAQRDYPAVAATSGLSAALKFGEIHPRSLVPDAEPRMGAEPFIRQLCWRDFYGHYLAARPDSARKNVQPAFDAMPWRHGPEALEAFDAWRTGRTGFPFVDAGMRELAATGTMHNRLRMVVASFLVKDLHIDWRWGARHFMQELYDGDLANNQHGWQWTAGTGTDAAPYFRIFNPVRQALRFDPQGDYVHRWVPELRGLLGQSAHQPWEHPRERWPEYPEAILDHAQERVVALALYEQAKAADVQRRSRP